MDENLMDILMIGFVMLVFAFGAIHDSFCNRDEVYDEDVECFECVDPPHYSDPYKVKNCIKLHSIFKGNNDQHSISNPYSRNFDSTISNQE